jgi:hypothetical protein
MRNCDKSGEVSLRPGWRLGIMGGGRRGQVPPALSKGHCLQADTWTPGQEGDGQNSPDLSQKLVLSGCVVPAAGQPSTFPGTESLSRQSTSYCDLCLAGCSNQGGIPALPRAKVTVLWVLRCFLFSSPRNRAYTPG